MPLPVERRVAPTSFPLASAYICGNCDQVGNSSTQCPHCQSNSLHSLAKQLGGNVGEQPLQPSAKPKAGARKLAYVGKCPGHRNSQGELAEWCVFKHETGKILTSYGSEEASKEGLKNMESHKGSANPLLRHEAEGEATAPAAAPTPTKSVIAIEGYEKQRGRGGFKRQIWFYVTGFTYSDGPGLKIKKVQYSMDKAKAKQMGKLDAQSYADQLNSRAFGLKAKVEPAV